jgi:hypothetical protein
MLTQRQVRKAQQKMKKSTPEAVRKMRRQRGASRSRARFLQMLYK